MPVGAGDDRTLHGLVKVIVVGELVEESPLAVAVPLKEILSAFASVNKAQLIAVVTNKAKTAFFMIVFLFFRVVVVIEAFL
jgi:hypothetical protein